MATYYLDLEGGNDANTGLSFAQRVKTWAVASALLSPGDTLRVMASVGPLAMSKNITWANGSYFCTLSGAVNADIDTGEVAWTASSNVTCTLSTTRKEGLKSASIAVGASFTTGLAAYAAFSSTDFSAYQQISFWIQQTAGTLGLASSLSIVLCSDAVGATPVDTLNLPAIPALNAWFPVVINNAGALGASIQSVAFYVNTDNGAQTFLLDNIIAVKAAGGQDELNHQMLIGKLNSVGGGGTDAQAWMPIRSIRNTIICFDDFYSSSPIVQQGTFPPTPNTSEVVTGYTFTPSYSPGTVVAADLNSVFPGTGSSRLTVSGGWDRVGMTSQTGHTVHAVPAGINITFSWILTYVDFSKVLMGRWSTWNQYSRVSTFDRFGVFGTNATFWGNDNTYTNFFAVGVQSTTFSGANTLVVGLFGSSSTAQVTLTFSGGAFGIASAGSIVYALSVTSGQGMFNYNGTIYGGFSSVSETGLAQAGGASSVTLRSGASSVNDLYANQGILIYGGTGAGQTNKITAYNGTTKVATVSTAWVTQPDSTSAYIVLGRLG